jgi:hypothetical protein
MTDVVLLIIVVGMIILALGVNVGVVIGWLRRRW